MKVTDKVAKHSQSRRASPSPSQLARAASGDCASDGGLAL